MRDFRQKLVGLIIVSAFFASAQCANSEAHSTPRSTSLRDRFSRSVCSGAGVDPAARAALHLVCRQRPEDHARTSKQVIVIGFLGGFANPNDQKHPEVLFAEYLEEHYGSNLHAEVFSNHDEERALRYVIALLDTNHDGVLSEKERGRARIIIYGHSWGASETTAFAGELRRHAIPVLLTIQLDLIPKVGQKAFQIPINVRRAVNFYQAEGLLRGQTEIRAADSTRTQIIGNFRLAYAKDHINCRNYSWFARTFNKPHHEIENDPKVWEKIASFIDAEMSTPLHANLASGYRRDVIPSLVSGGH